MPFPAADVAAIDVDGADDNTDEAKEGLCFLAVCTIVARELPVVTTVRMVMSAPSNVPSVYLAASAMLRTCASASP